MVVRRQSMQPMLIAYVAMRATMARLILDFLQEERGCQLCV